MVTSCFSTEVPPGRRNRSQSDKGRSSYTGPKPRTEDRRSYDRAVAGYDQSYRVRHDDRRICVVLRVRDEETSVTMDVLVSKV